jgi:hypothetical protein
VLRRIVAHCEAEASRQGNHGFIVGQDETGQPVNVLLSCISDELLQQQAANASPLPCIHDADANLRSAGLVRFAIARDADELLDSSLLRCGDKSHPLPIIDVHQLLDQMTRQELQRREEPEVA